MAITRLWQSGFELQELLREVTGVSNANVALSASDKKTGNFGLAFSGNQSAYNAFVDLPGTHSQMRTSFHFRNALGSGSETPDIISFQSSTTPRIRVRWRATTQIFEVVVGASTILATGGYIPFLTPSTWFHFSFDFKLDASGWARLYVDGNLIIDFSGNTSGAGGTINRYTIGMSTTNNRWDNRVIAYDDMYLDNTTGEVAPSFAPDYRYGLIQVAGNGSASEWVGNDGNSVDNYLLVDEIPHDGDSTYVATSLDAQQDYYESNTLVLPDGWSIASVIPMAMAKKDSAPTTLGVKLLTKVGVDEQASATKTLGTDYTNVWERYTQKPSGGAWDQSSLDDLELGIESASA